MTNDERAWEWLVSMDLASESNRHAEDIAADRCDLAAMLDEAEERSRNETMRKLAHWLLFMAKQSEDMPAPVAIAELAKTLLEKGMQS